MAEDNSPIRHNVYRSINKPLLFFGVDRALFFFAVVIGAAVFNLFSSLVGGSIVFAAFYGFARWATKTDEQILRIMIKPLLNPEKFRPLIDPGKICRSDLVLERDR